jgi:hypothetical protein
MYALATSPRYVLHALAMQYSPYKRLNVENDVSALTVIYHSTPLLLPRVLRIITELRLSGGPISILEFLLDLIIGFTFI